MGYTPSIFGLPQNTPFCNNVPMSDHADGSRRRRHPHHSPGHRGHDRGCPEGRECHCAGNGPRIHGFLIPCILFDLNSEPSHGYRLMEMLSKRSYISQLPDPGVLYRHLRRLEQHGLATSTIEPGEGPARRVYTITDEGKACLSDWIAGLQQLQATLSDFISNTKRDGNR